MRKMKLSRLLCICVYLFTFFESGCEPVKKNNYTDTSNVNYSERIIRLLAIDFVGNPYLKSYDVKISINIPIRQKLLHEDSLLIKSYTDSIFLSLKIKERSTIRYVVFNETNYTNKCFSEKKGLLFTEISPYVYTHSFIYEPAVHSVRKKEE